MANHPNRSRTCRPREHVRAAGHFYPQAWKQVDIFRASRSKDVPAWPDWCFLPLSAAYAIVSADHGVSRITDPAIIGDVARLGALATWRVTQGIYRIDPALFLRLWETPVSGDIPVDVLYRLPEWCVYIETPDTDMHGFFAHLEWDIPHQRPELRLLLDTEDTLSPIVLHLGKQSLHECIAQAVDQAKTCASTFGMLLPDKTTTMTTELVEPCISLLLYLCSQNSEINGKGIPGNPKPKKTKNGWRIFPADQPKTWDVGVRLGAALRAAYQQQEIGSESGQGSGKRPHIRRAHWHTYWIGSGDEKTATLKWLPPIAVKLDGEELPATIHKVTD